MQQRVVVLGASGFIGRRVMAALRRTGWATPVGVSRQALGFDRRSYESLTFDATDATALARALDGASAVVNCVAGSAYAITRTAELLFATAAAMARPPRIVHMSSLAVYGSEPRDVDESSRPAVDLDPYGAAKVQADDFAARYGRAVVLRPGIVYGPESPWWSDRIARLLIARRLGDLGSAGIGFCNLAYVEDVAMAVVQSLLLPSLEGRSFNLSMHEPPTWNEYFQRYSVALAATPVRRISAMRLAYETRLVGPLLKIAAIMLRSDRNLPVPIRPWLLRLCGQRVLMRSLAAPMALQLQWTPLDVGLEGTARWFLLGNRTP